MIYFPKLDPSGQGSRVFRCGSGGGASGGVIAAIRIHTLSGLLPARGSLRDTSIMSPLRFMAASQPRLAPQLSDFCARQRSISWCGFLKVRHLQINRGRSSSSVPLETASQALARALCWQQRSHRDLAAIRGVALMTSISNSPCTAQPDSAAAIQAALDSRVGRLVEWIGSDGCCIRGKTSLTQSWQHYLLLGKLLKVAQCGITVS